MNIENKRELTNFISENGKHRYTVNEIEDNIIEIISIGQISKKGFEKCIKFLNNYSKKKKKKLKLLTMNSKIKKVESDARNVFLKLLDKNSPIKKIATIGDNLFVRSYIKFYMVFNKGDMKVKSFKTVKQAFEWLKED